MIEVLENNYISREIENLAFDIEDYLEIKPLHGKKTIMELKRTQFDLVSEDQVVRAGKYFKVLPTLKGDSIFIRIKQVKIKSNNQVEKKRIMIESLNHSAFNFNESLVFSAILKHGDECELGHNLIRFKKRNSIRSTTQLHNELLTNKKVLKSKMNILLEGETGTGKTTLARQIHEHSNQSGQFIHINLSAFSPTLLESELFGHVKGAFTGALSEKKGALRQAHKGTLFLDEIDSIPKELQTKLLLFLDNGIIRPVGSMQEFQVDCRMIFASGISLFTKVEMGQMRKDFYFRLKSGHTHQLQSLRANSELIENFCLEFEIDQQIVIDKKLISFYQSLPWPGNIRQLSGHLKRKKLLSHSTHLTFDQYDDELIIQSSELGMIQETDCALMTLKQMKIAYAKKVYYKLNCNSKRVALALDISTKSLRNMIYEPII